MNLNTTIANLSSNKAIMKYQIDELLKAESALSELNKCITLQYSTLDILLKEGILLEGAIKQRSEILNIKKNKNVILADCKSNLKRQRSKSPKSDGETRRLKMKESKDDLETKIQSPKAKKTNIERNAVLSILKFPPFKGKDIHYLFIDKGDLYIGRSNGVIIRYAKGNITTFKKQTTESIRQIFLKKLHSQTFIIALSNSKLMKYSFDGTECTVNNIPDIRNICVKNSTIYITNNHGVVETVDLNDMNFLKNLNSTNAICCSMPAWTNELYLVSNKDSSLCKIVGPDNCSIVIDGVRNIEKIEKLPSNHSLCYSDNTMYILNPKFDVVHTRIVEDRIKLVTVNCKMIGVVDMKNTLVIIRATDFKEIYKGNIGRDVSAVCLRCSDSKALICVEDIIYTIKYTKYNY